MHKYILALIASAMVIPAYADVTDQVIVVSLTNDPIIITGVSDVDKHLIVSPINNHELRVIHPKLKSGDYVVAAKIGTNTCKIRVYANMLGESLVHYACARTATIQMDKQGMSSTYFIKVANK